LERENYNPLNFDKVTNLLSQILFVKLDRSVLYQFLDDSFECAKWRHEIYSNFVRTVSRNASS